MRRRFIAGISVLYLIGSVFMIRAAHAQCLDATVTEWPTPGYPFQIDASEGVTFFIELVTVDGLNVPKVGRLDPASNSLTEWELPFSFTSPGDIAIQTDGSGSQFVWVTDITNVEIGRLDPATDEFKEWTIPGVIGGGPRDFAIDSSGDIFFSVWNTVDGSRIGRLTPTTNTITLWDPPSDRVADVAVDPWGNVFFAILGASSPPSGNKIGMLDPTSNVVTEWPMPNTPHFAIETDPLGNAYFWEIGPSPLRKIAKLQPSTNTLMEWDYSDNNPSEFISVDTSGKVFLAESTVNAVVRLDPSIPEVVTVLNPTTTAVALTDSPVVPTSANYPPITSSVAPTISCVTGMDGGAFTEWTLPVPDSYPRGISADQIGNVFFTEQGPFNNAIGRLHLGLEVLIDIRPLSERNLVYPRGRGFIAVAILSARGFDAATVDPLTVRFGPSGASRLFRGFLVDVDRDGDRDLLLFFRIRETGIVCGDTEATLTGETFEGVPIKGSDAIRTVGCRR